MQAGAQQAATPVIGLLNVRARCDTSIRLQSEAAAAERMRLYRQRRRDGSRCLMLEIREAEVDALIRKGLLTAETRNDPNAVTEAVQPFLDETLGSDR
jgi:hypothetical protein